MSEQGMVSLQSFVTTYLQRTGAVMDQPSYAYLEALLPEKIVQHLGSEHLLLAFDYEVAGENAGSQFVTHGSQFLDKVTESTINSYGRFTVLYRPGSPPQLPRNFEQKILAKLEFRRCRTPKVSMQIVEEYVYFGFYFRCIFRSYEKSEEILTIVMNGNNGLVQPDFPVWWQKIVPSERPEYTLSQASRWSVEELYKTACQEIEKAAQAQAAKIVAEVAEIKQRELAKIASYYRELTTELKRKLEGTEDSDKKNRLVKQLAATEADQERRVKDANERYGVEVEASLDHVIAYHVPCVRVKLEIQHKGEVLYYTVLYNPLAGEIETPICESCGRPIVCLVPDKGRLVCAECL
ncbi:MAG: hypothetical protein ACYDEJ_07080 [Desulfitobacteriaceae bacterium]